MSQEHHINEKMSQKILLEAQENLVIIFGSPNDPNLLELIPAADHFEKINATCHYCHITAGFRVKEKCVCRECKIKLNN